MDQTILFLCFGQNHLFDVILGYMATHPFFWFNYSALFCLSSVFEIPIGTIMSVITYRITEIITIFVDRSFSFCSAVANLVTFALITTATFLFFSPNSYISCSSLIAIVLLEFFFFSWNRMSGLISVIFPFDSSNNFSNKH